MEPLAPAAEQWVTTQLDRLPPLTEGQCREAAAIFSTARPDNPAA